MRARTPKTKRVVLVITGVVAITTFKMAVEDW